MTVTADENVQPTSMNQFHGQALSWELKDGVVELALHRAPMVAAGRICLKANRSATVPFSLLKTERRRRPVLRRNEWPDVATAAGRARSSTITSIR